MVFDVGRDMLVVGGCAGERRITRMGLRVVPVQFLAAVPDLLAVALDSQGASVPGQTLVHNQAMTAGENELAA